MRTQTKEDRFYEIIDNLSEWATNHEEVFVECFVHAMDLTKEEFEDFGWRDYFGLEFEEFNEKFE